MRAPGDYYDRRVHGERRFVAPADMPWFFGREASTSVGFGMGLNREQSARLCGEPSRIGFDVLATSSTANTTQGCNLTTTITEELGVEINVCGYGAQAGGSRSESHVSEFCTVDDACFVGDATCTTNTHSEGYFGGLTAPVPVPGTPGFMIDVAVRGNVNHQETSTYPGDAALLEAYGCEVCAFSASQAREYGFSATGSHTFGDDINAWVRERFLHTAIGQYFEATAKVEVEFFGRVVINDQCDDYTVGGSASIEVAIRVGFLPFRFKLKVPYGYTFRDCAPETANP